MLPSEIPKLPHGLARERVSPGQVSLPNSFVSLFVFYILSYLLSKRMGCLSEVLVVFQGPLEVALWKFLSMQMIFWWICGGESGLSILFLHHLTHLQPDILECEVKWALGSITTNKASGVEFQLIYFVS